MKIFEVESKYIPNPFPASKIKKPLFHGTAEKFSKFLRPAHGIYVTPHEDWAQSHYGGTVLVIYANVKKMLKVNWDESAHDAFYDRDYKRVAEYLEKWSAQGYDCCKFGGESDSMVLFNNIEIVDATTGRPM